jgi:hypothetical protein
MSEGNVSCTGTSENRRKFTTKVHLEGLLRREQQTTVPCGGVRLVPALDGVEGSVE